MVLIKCKKCKYTWEYKGRNEYFATCSRCMNRNLIKLTKVLENVPIN